MIRIILLIIVVILLLITFLKKTLENFVFDISGTSGGATARNMSCHPGPSFDPCECYIQSFTGGDQNSAITFPVDSCVADGTDITGPAQGIGLCGSQCCAVTTTRPVDQETLVNNVLNCGSCNNPNYCPLVLTDGDKKMIDNVIDNSVNVDTLNETQDNKSRLNQVLNMAEELSEKVPKLINRFKETQQREKVSENRI